MGPALPRRCRPERRRQISQPQVLDLNQAMRRMQHMLGHVIGEHITFAMNVRH
jgi:hypothetical protein